MELRKDIISDFLKKLIINPIISVIKKYDYFFFGKSKLLLSDRYNPNMNILVLSNDQIVIDRPQEFKIYDLNTQISILFDTNAKYLSREDRLLSNNRLVRIFENGSIEIWDLITYRLILYKSLAFTKEIIDSLILPDDTIVIVIDEYNIISYNIEMDKITYNTTSDEILAITSNENTIIAFLINGSMQIVGTNKIYSYETKINSARVIDENILLGLNNGILAKIDLNTGNSISAAKVHNKFIRDIAVLSNGYIVTISLDEYLKVTDLKNRRIIFEQKIADPKEIYILPNDNILVISKNNLMKIWDIDSESSIVLNTLGRILSLYILPSGRILVSSLNGNTWNLILWE